MLTNPFVARSAHSNIPYKSKQNPYKSSTYLPPSNQSKLFNYNYQNNFNPFILHPSSSSLHASTIRPNPLVTSRSLYNNAVAIPSYTSINNQEDGKRNMENPFLYKFPTRFIRKQSQELYNSLKGSGLSSWQREEYLNKYLNQNNIARSPQLKINNAVERQYKAEKQYTFEKDYKLAQSPRFEQPQAELLKKLSKPPLRNKQPQSQLQINNPSKIKTKSSIYLQLPNNQLQKDYINRLPQLTEQNDSFIQKLITTQNKRYNPQQKPKRFTNSHVYQIDPENPTYRHYQNNQYPPSPSNNRYKEPSPNMYDDNDNFDFNRNQYQSKEYRVKVKSYADQQVDHRNNSYEVKNASRDYANNEYPKQIMIKDVVYDMIEIC